MRIFLTVAWFVSAYARKFYARIKIEAVYEVSRV